MYKCPGVTGSSVQIQTKLRVELRSNYLIIQTDCTDSGQT